MNSKCSVIGKLFAPLPKTFLNFFYHAAVLLDNTSMLGCVFNVNGNFFPGDVHAKTHKMILNETTSVVLKSITLKLFTTHGSMSTEDGHFFTTTQMN